MTFIIAAHHVMLTVAILSVVMLSVVMLGVIMLGVVMLSVVMLSVIMLGVVMLSVVMLSAECGDLPGTNTPTYLAHSKVTKMIKFFEYGPR